MIKTILLLIFYWIRTPLNFKEKESRSDYWRIENQNKGVCKYENDRCKLMIKRDKKQKRLLLLDSLSAISTDRSNNLRSFVSLEVRSFVGVRKERILPKQVTLSSLTTDLIDRLRGTDWMYGRLRDLRNCTVNIILEKNISHYIKIPAKTNTWIYEIHSRRSE